MKYQNLDQAQSFKDLNKTTPVNIKEELTEERVKKYEIETGSSIKFNYAALPVNDIILKRLVGLGTEQALVEKFRLILSGETMNPGEGRKVLHHLTRMDPLTPVIFENNNIRNFYMEQQERINIFAGKIHSGQIKGSTDKKFDTVIQIGIGGSDLGPRAMYIALKEAVGKKAMMTADFISNVDPDDAASVLVKVNLESTLFILVSKSGTTQETLANRDLAIKWMKNKNPNLIPEKHMIAVTSATSPLANSDSFLDSFYIDDFIGGRYSSTSAVGGAVLTLAFGKEVFREFLEGAASSDKNALNKNINENAALMDALIGCYMRNILDYRVSAVLPYSQGMSRFPAHLQQLDMESNGKSVNRHGDSLDYQTGPVIFGEPGTNGQHSFYQLLHQGTDIIPLQFIGFKESQQDVDLEIDGTTNQTKLNANLTAQIIAFAKGSPNPDSNKNFNGSRPSSLLYGERLTPETLGALLSHFENKVMFQGFVWNINSFDQEGVQLGKKLTNQILSGESNDKALNLIAGKLGI
ncbi:MAG: glucose-6-phosphate isomerase [Spirochaetia bacterium]|jgi:glucose-6-phosphate isomerase|nr:glucose-6-phosphate isomerase [Spirochaetia bacterium]